jgi:adenylyltransferase/sulfurtransferase
VLEPLGEEGQRALGGARATVVGAGGLGTNSVELLVRMGVGHVRIIDGDVVELSNLHRVRLFGEVDVGRPKAEALAQHLEELIPEAEVEPLSYRLGPGNAIRLIDGSDVVLDGLDNMEGRYILNDACLELGVPWVHGGVLATGGLVAPFPGRGPCLRCLFPQPPEPDVLPSTVTMGVHPSLPAAVASVQVALATRIVLGTLGRPMMLIMDLWTDDWRTVSLEQRTSCPSCSGGGRDFLKSR